MIKPSYTPGFWNNASLEEFIKAHLDAKIEYFLYLSDEQWQAEYATATGYEANYVSDNTENAGKAIIKKPKKQGV